MGKGCTATADQSCRQCQAGRFKVAVDFSSCQPCRACGAGAEVVSDCSASVNRVCRCIAGYDSLSAAGSTCVLCTAGAKFKPTAGPASCQTCRTCGQGTEVVSECTPTANRQCQCGTGYDSLNHPATGQATCSLCAAPTGTNAGGKFKASAGAAACQSCRSCDGASAQEVSACTATQDRTCECKAGADSLNGAGTTCSACTTGKFKVSTGAGSCQACAICPPRIATEELKCLPVQDRTCLCQNADSCPSGTTRPQPCTPCSVCKPGFGQWAAAGCTACEAGATFQAGKTTGACGQCATCDAGSAVKVSACVTTTNAVCTCRAGYDSLSSDGTSCMACAAPSAANVGGAFKPKQGDGSCSACRKCGGGAVVQSACTATADRSCVCDKGFDTMSSKTHSCVPCIAPTGTNSGGFFKYAVGNAGCAACRVCGVGAEESAACTAVADRACKCKVGFHGLNAAGVACTENRCAAFAVTGLEGVEGVEGDTNGCVEGVVLSTNTKPTCDLRCAMGYSGQPMPLVCASNTSHTGAARTAIQCEPCVWEGWLVTSVGASVTAKGARGTLQLRLAAPISAGYKVEVAERTNGGVLGEQVVLVTNTVGKGMPPLRMRTVDFSAAKRERVVVTLNAPISAGTAEAPDFAVEIDGTTTPVVKVSQSAASVDPGVVIIDLKSTAATGQKILVRYTARKEAARLKSSGGALADTSVGSNATSSKVVVVAAVVRGGDPSAIVLSFNRALSGSEGLDALNYAVSVRGDLAWGRRWCMPDELAQATLAVCPENSTVFGTPPADGLVPVLGKAWADGTACERRTAASCTGTTAGACAAFDPLPDAAVGGILFRRPPPSSADPAGLLVVETPYNPLGRVLSVTFVADGRTLSALRMECDFASSVKDPQKQRYIHRFSSQCVNDQPQKVSVRLDSDHLLKHAGEQIVGCDRVRFMLHARALGLPRILRDLQIHRNVCGAGSYFSERQGECVACERCNKAAGAFRDGCGQRSAGQCVQCAKGKYADDGLICEPCTEPGILCLDGTQQKCPAGHFCPSPTEQTVCAAGTFCEEGSAKQEPCPTGKYQPAQGSAKCKTCTEGETFQNATGQERCQKCTQCGKGEQPGAYQR